jgi:hypothetical protein
VRPLVQEQVQIGHPISNPDRSERDDEHERHAPRLQHARARDAEGEGTHAEKNVEVDAPVIGRQPAHEISQAHPTAVGEMLANPGECVGIIIPRAYREGWDRFSILPV